ncbi:hypothetical protein GCM10023238_02510 [Streptomyces heliomycini]
MAWTGWTLTLAQVATLAEHDRLLQMHPETATRWRLKAKDRVGSVRLGAGRRHGPADHQPQGARRHRLLH